MDKRTQTLLDAVRQMTALSTSGAQLVRASDLRGRLARIAELGCAASAPFEPTEIQMRAALERIAAGGDEAGRIAREALQ